MPNFWQTGTPHILKIQWFPLIVLILGQKSCYLGPTIFKIPHPNWCQYSLFTAPLDLKNLTTSDFEKWPCLYWTILTIKFTNQIYQCWIEDFLKPASRIRWKFQLSISKTVETNQKWASIPQNPVPPFTEQIYNHFLWFYHWQTLVQSTSR